MENSLVIKNLQYFIGSRTENGKYSVFSSSMNIEHFKKFCIENLGLETQTHDDSNRLLLNINYLLEGFTKNIIDTIRSENNNFFNKLLDHTQNGVLRQFSQDYNRIKDGGIDYNYGLRLEINTLIEHHLSIFLTSHLYRWEAPSYRRQDAYEHVLYIKEFKGIFSIMVNLLCMSIMIEYKISKNYFKDDFIIKNNINQIKEKLNNVFLEPIRSKSLDEFYAYCLFKKPDLLEKYLTIHNKKINLYDCHRSIKYSTKNNYDISKENNYMKKIDYSVSTLNDTDNVFNQVIDLMGIINMVEYMYEKLKANCNSDSNDENVLVEFEILFNK